MDLDTEAIMKARVAKITRKGYNGRNINSCYGSSTLLMRNTGLFFERFCSKIW
jgi:hypothetical protein